MYQTRADRRASTTASTTCRAARCWAGPARSTPWSIRVARPATSTIGRRWAIPAGDGRTSCRVYKRMEDHALGAGALSRRRRAAACHAKFRKPCIRLTHPYVKAGAGGGAEVQPRPQRRQPSRVSAIYQINTRGGLRMSASRAYLWPARRRRNLRIETDALATRVLLEGNRAVGIAYQQGGKMREARARPGGDPRRRRRQLAAAAAALGHRPGGPAARARHRGAAATAPRSAATCRTICASTMSTARHCRASTRCFYPWWGKLRGRAAATC